MIYSRISALDMSALCFVVMSSMLTQGCTTSQDLGGPRNMEPSASAQVIPDGIAISPKTVTMLAGAPQKFTVAFSVSRTKATFVATGGTITDAGLYTAPATAGRFYVIASQQGGAKSDTATITVSAPVPTLTSLVMTPNVVSIAPGAKQQFAVAAMWSNGSTTLPALTYSATGGTVSPSGLFTAGSAAGSYRVIVSGGGKTDTSAATVPLVLGDQQFYSKGQYGAYASPWSTLSDNTLKRGIDYSDSIEVNAGAFPNSSVIKWRWPQYVSPKTGVWGYMFVFFGNYDGGEPAVKVQPRQVKNITVLKEDFSLTHSGLGYNVLNEFYLTSAAGDPAAKVIEIGYFLHMSTDAVNFFTQGRLIGSYIDAAGRSWEARMQGTFCMLRLTGGGDVSSGSVDIKATLDFLKSKAVITGNEWFNGIGMGIEPTRGAGQMQVTQWTMTYQ